MLNKFESEKDKLKKKIKTREKKIYLKSNIGDTNWKILRRIESNHESIY